MAVIYVHYGYKENSVTKYNTGNVSLFSKNPTEEEVLAVVREAHPKGTDFYFLEIYEVFSENGYK